MRLRRKFTQKERDTETGLDFFGARYYASAQGRFTGADPYDANFERQVPANPEEADSLRELGSVEKAKDWARNEATNFINTNMGQAKDLYEKSNQTNSEASKLILTVSAFESFGKGAHTIMDGASPAHTDFQVYDTQGTNSSPLFRRS